MYGCILIGLGVIIICFLGGHSTTIYVFLNVLKENKDKCIELNVNVSYLVSHSYQNVADTLCTSDFTVAYPTIFICLHTVWFIGNVKSGYL